MKINFHLAMKAGKRRNGAEIRLSKGPPTLGPNEVGIRVALSVPDALFASFLPEASITVQEKHLTRPKIVAVVAEPEPEADSK